MHFCTSPEGPMTVTRQFSFQAAPSYPLSADSSTEGQEPRTFLHSFAV